MRTGFLLQLNSKLEENACQLRIIFVGYGVGRQEGMNAEMLNALCLENFISLNNLLVRHAVFCIAGVIHDVVGDCKMSARIIAAADGFRNIGNLFEEVDMGEIIKVDGYVQLACQLEVLSRSCVGGEHNLALLEAHSVAHEQLGVGGAVSATALLTQDLQQVRVRRSLNCEILLEAFVPGESFIYQTSSAADACFVIQMKRSRKLLHDFFQLFFSYEGNFFSHLYHLSAIVSMQFHFLMLL